MSKFLAVSYVFRENLKVFRENFKKIKTILKIQQLPHTLLLFSFNYRQARLDNNVLQEHYSMEN